MVKSLISFPTLQYSNTPFLPNFTCAAGLQPDLLIENWADGEVIPAAAFDFVMGGCRPNLDADRLRVPEALSCSSVPQTRHLP